MLVKDIVQLEPKFIGCHDNEPDLERMIFDYYRQHFDRAAAASLTRQYIGKLSVLAGE